MDKQFAYSVLFQFSLCSTAFFHVIFIISFLFLHFSASFSLFNPFPIFSLSLILHSCLPAFLTHTNIQKEKETDVNLFMSLVPSNRQL